jgi:hypothetical protein
MTKKLPGIRKHVWLASVHTAVSQGKDDCRSGRIAFQQNNFVINPTTQPSTHPSNHTPIHQTIHPSTEPTTHSSNHPPVYWTIHASIKPSTHPPNHTPIHQTIHASIKPSTRLLNHPRIHQTIPHPSNHTPIYWTIHPSINPSNHTPILSTCQLSIRPRSPVTCYLKLVYFMRPGTAEVTDLRDQSVAAQRYHVWLATSRYPFRSPMLRPSQAYGTVVGQCTCRWRGGGSLWFSLFTGKFWGTVFKAGTVLLSVSRGEGCVRKRQWLLGTLIWIFGEISGSHGGEYEDDCLLGCCAV